MKTILSLFCLLSLQNLAFASDTDCDGVCGQSIASEFNSSLFQSLANISRFSGDSAFPETLPNDPRKVRSSTSPKWLAAVGRMVSRISSTKQEQCSLTLLNDHPSKDGIIAVTAGHCVDHWRTRGKYVVGHNEITFTTNSGKTVKRSIVKVLRTEMNPADFAIVKLNKAISKNKIQPLLNSPYDYSDIMNDEDFSQKFKAFATMAGYSTDKGLGKKGKVLTYHEKCKLNGGRSGLKKGYCYTYEGASGGPVVTTVAFDEETGDISDDLQLGGTTQHLFVGSIVGGRGGDNNSKTLFTENSHYSTSLDDALAAH